MPNGQINFCERRDCEAEGFTLAFWTSEGELKCVVHGVVGRIRKMLFPVGTVEGTWFCGGELEALSEVQSGS
jgi:hypothetical protein